MIHIETNPDLGDFVKHEILEHAAQKVLEHESVSTNASLTIVLTDDAHLHKLNRDYLGIDAPTDVLSFAANETDPESGMTYLGDILISVPRAEAQSSSYGHTLEAEVQLLVVHGVLHLLGYDHADGEGKAMMWNAQADILAQLGLAGIAIQE